MTVNEHPHFSIATAFVSRFFVIILYSAAIKNTALIQEVGSVSD